MFKIQDKSKHVDTKVANSTHIKSNLDLSAKLLRSEQQLESASFDSIESTTLLTSSLTTNNESTSYSNVICGTDDGNDNDNSNPCIHLNDTCVGAPEYCNYTKEEYIKMLEDYIWPSTGVWILIGFHAAVFLIGLVSLFIYLLSSFMYFHIKIDKIDCFLHINFRIIIMHRQSVAMLLIFM